MLREAAVQSYDKIIALLPEVVLAVIIIVLGGLAASIVYSLTIRVLGFFAVDKLAGKTPLERMLRSIGIHRSVSAIIAWLLFWMTILVTLVFASEILHLEQVSEALAVVLRYIPQVIAALLIIVFGMLLAKFLQTLVTQAVARVQLGHEQSFGKAVHVLVLILVFLVASQQLGFDLSFVTTNVMILLLAVALLAGVAVIVGARSVLENALACRQVRQQVHKGKTLRIGEVEGVVKGFTLTGVIVEHAGKETIVPATFFFHHTYTLSGS